MRKQILLMCLMLLVVIGRGQTAAATSGGEASGSSGTVSYSVGQVSYQTHTGTSGSVSEGVQQPFEISVVTAVEKAKKINLTVSAYPNPTTDYLILEVNDFELSKLNFQLYDMQGKLLQNEQVTGVQTSIVMSKLVPATYFVKIIQNKNEIKTFKIIKN